MERYVEEAKQRYVFRAVICGVIAVFLCITGVGCFVKGVDSNDDDYFAVGTSLLFYGVAMIICVLCIITRAINYNKICAPIEDIIRRYGETGENIGGVVVGERLAYIPSSRIFIVYQNVKWIERRENFTAFYMRDGSVEVIKNKDLLQSGFGAICGRIRAKHRDVLFGEGKEQQWQEYVNDYKKVYQYREEPEDEPDIVYVDDNGGSYGNGGYDSESGYNGGLL